MACFPTIGLVVAQVASVGLDESCGPCASQDETRPSPCPPRPAWYVG
jgi:hypothetical protein